MPDAFLRYPFPAQLLEMEAWAAGDDTAAYRAGWGACMAWEARVPPEGLGAEDREMWMAGYDEAMDAPLGSRPRRAEQRRSRGSLGR